MITTTNTNTPCIVKLCEKKEKTYTGTFDIILLETIDEMFSSFGRSCKQAIYAQLKNTFKIKKQEIPIRIEDFAKAIEQIFGIGAKFIELKIIATLHKKVPNFVYSPQMVDIVFADYVASLRRYFLVTNCKYNRSRHIQRKQNALQLLCTTTDFLSP